MEVALVVFLLLIAIYPTWLIWRFLTLAIKCMKKYLRDNDY